MSSTGHLLAHYLELLLTRSGKPIDTDVRAELAELAEEIDQIAPPLHEEIGRLRDRLDHAEAHLDTLDRYLESRSRT